jgi:hypothetical protein
VRTGQPLGVLLEELLHEGAAVMQGTSASPAAWTLSPPAKTGHERALSCPHLLVLALGTLLPGISSATTALFRSSIYM